MSAVKTFGPLPTEKQLKASLKSLKYTQHGLVAKHVVAAAEKFPDVKPSIKECTYADPSIRGATLVQLAGNVRSSGTEQPIPVRIWLNRDYPKEKPVIFINLSPNMTFSDADYIKADGRVELLQIMSWKEGKSDLCTLIQELHSKFSKCCPINPLKLRSSFGQFTFRQLKNAHSTLSLRSFDDTGRKGSFNPPVVRDCGHTSELAQLRSEAEEQRTKIESLEETLKETRGKVAYYRNQANELEEKLQTRPTNARGSFASGVFDALMQHDVWKEKKEKEECQQQIEKMIAELTEHRERIGILQADKEEYQERLGVLGMEYQRLKHIYCKLVRERRFVIEQRRRMQTETQTDSEESEDECNNVIIEEARSKEPKEIPISNHQILITPPCDSEKEQSQEATRNTVQESTQQIDTSISTASTEVKVQSTDKASVYPPLAIISCYVTVEHENELPRQVATPPPPPPSAQGDTLTHSTEVALPRITIEQLEKLSEQLKEEKELLKKQSEQLKEEVQSLTEKTHSQAAEIESLEKRMVAVKQEGEETNEMLKKLLDNAMRKIRKFEYSADKEEQLEKQKQFLKAKLDRSITDRALAEKKLKDENRETRQKLKEALNRAESLEAKLKSLKHSSSSTASDVSSSVSPEEEPFLQSQGSQALEPEDIASVLDHLDVLLSK